MNSDSGKQSEFKDQLRAAARSWLPFVVIIAVVYFGNVEIQSYLGRKALDEMGMPLLSLDEALAKAKQENKLVLADMSAIWCPACRRLDSEVLSQTRVQDAIESKYIFARVEYESDEGEAFMKKYGVQGFPTLVVIDAEGYKVKQLPLSFNPEEFVSFL